MELMLWETVPCSRFSLFPASWETNCGQFGRALKQPDQIKIQCLVIFWDLVIILVGNFRLGFEVDLLTSGDLRRVIPHRGIVHHGWVLWAHSSSWNESHWIGLHRNTKHTLWHNVACYKVCFHITSEISPPMIFLSFDWSKERRSTKSRTVTIPAPVNCLCTCPHRHSNQSPEVVTW